MNEMEVVADAAALAARAADLVAEQLALCQDPFRLVLSGGETPRQTYRLLAAKNALSWDCTEIFFGDERFVPPDSPDSNYRMARKALLDHIHPRKVFAMPTDGTPQSAAARYEEELVQQYGASTLSPEAPLFDLTLLGLGADGHTASLLPGQPVLQERAHWVAAVAQGRDQPRLTLTYPALQSSRLIVFLVSGAPKREALARALAGDASIPAGAIRSQGRVLFLADKAAAGQ